MLGSDKHIVDYRTVGQNICYTKFKKISNSGSQVREGAPIIMLIDATISKSALVLFIYEI